MKETIAGARQTPWPTLDRQSLKLTAGSLAKLRQVIDVEIDVVRNKQIEFAVVVIIHESGAGGPARIADARFLSDVGKRAVAVISEKMVGPETRYVDIVGAIIIVISDCHSHAPA